MAKQRKTIEVSDLKTQINFMLANSRCSVDGRRSMMVIIETVLMDTKNYKGFVFLGEKEVPDGEFPGIFDSQYAKKANPTHDDLFYSTDTTRVRYI